MGGLPDLLTIEEAARVIRVGRTKAYAMAREWRATGGASGLPVVDFGHALRVPLCQLERIVGGPLAVEEASGDSTAPALEPEAPPTADESPCDEMPATPTLESAPAASTDPSPDAPSTPSRPARRPSRRGTGTPDQPTLPFAS